MEIMKIIITIFYSYTCTDPAIIIITIFYSYTCTDPAIIIITIFYSYICTDPAIRGHRPFSELYDYTYYMYDYNYVIMCVYQYGY